MERAKKNHNQVEANILDSRTSNNGGWLIKTDLLMSLMCLQHLYLKSSTPTIMYPIYVCSYNMQENFFLFFKFFCDYKRSNKMQYHVDYNNNKFYKSLV